MIAQHYFPHWLAWTGRKLSDPTRMILNYVIGSGGWFGLYALSLIFDGFAYLAIRGAVFLTTAGLTVMVLYALDHYVRERQRLRDLKEQMELLRKRNDATDTRT